MHPTKLILFGVIALVALSGCVSTPTGPVYLEEGVTFCTKKACSCTGQTVSEIECNSCVRTRRVQVGAEIKVERCSGADYVQCTGANAGSYTVRIDESSCVIESIPVAPPEDPNPGPEVSVNTITDTQPTSPKDGSFDCDALLQPLAACPKLAEGKFVLVLPGETKELYAGEQLSLPTGTDTIGLCVWEYAEHPTEGTPEEIFSNTRSTYVQVQIQETPASAKFLFDGFKTGGGNNGQAISDTESLFVEEGSTTIPISSRSHFKVAGPYFIQIIQSKGSNKEYTCTPAQENAIVASASSP